jgi:hypothetical protein
LWVFAKSEKHASSARAPAAHASIDETTISPTLAMNPHLKHCAGNMSPALRRKSFLVLFFKKEQPFFFEKKAGPALWEAKNFYLLRV